MFKNQDTTNHEENLTWPRRALWSLNICQRWVLVCWLYSVITIIVYLIFIYILLLLAMWISNTLFNNLLVLQWSLINTQDNLYLFDLFNLLKESLKKKKFLNCPLLPFKLSQNPNSKAFAWVPLLPILFASRSSSSSMLKVGRFFGAALASITGSNVLPVKSAGKFGPQCTLKSLFSSSGNHFFLLKIKIFSKN